MECICGNTDVNSVEAFKKYLFLYYIYNFLVFLGKKDMSLFSFIWNKVSHKKFLRYSGHTMFVN